jgi:hypothetical protein
MGKFKSLVKRYGTRPIRAFWWRHPDPTTPNFGDELTPFLLARLFDRRCTWTSPSECEFAGVGSIIELLSGDVADNTVDIWGSGFIAPDRAHLPRSMRFHAVRGPLSSARVEARGMLALGDPGILMGRAWPLVSKPQHRIGLIPHYVDRHDPLVQQLRERFGAHVISVHDDPASVAAQITSCAVILSSSLHGLIVSDSYGVPNYHIEMRRLVGAGYKFSDYYLSLGLRHTPLDPGTLESNRDIDDLINGFVSRQAAVTRLQDGLLAAFPYQ